MKITKKNFNDQLANFIATAKTMRDQFDALLKFGLRQAKAGNPDYLIACRSAAADVRSCNEVLIDEFVSSCSNLEWVENKKGTGMTYRKTSDAEPLRVEVPRIKWYNFKADATIKAPSPVDVIKDLEREVTKIEKAKAGFVQDDILVKKAKDKIAKVIADLKKLQAEALKAA